MHPVNSPFPGTAVAEATRLGRSSRSNFCHRVNGGERMHWPSFIWGVVATIVLGGAGALLVGVIGGWNSD